MRFGLVHQDKGALLNLFNQFRDGQQNDLVSRTQPSKPFAGLTPEAVFVEVQEVLYL